MSLRPEISGFEMKKMEGLFGRKDAKLISDLLAFFEKFWGFEDEDLLGRADKLIKQIIDGKIKKGKVEIEDELFVYVMVAFAYYRQKHVPTESNCWDSSFIDYVFDFKQNPPKDIDNPEAWKEVMGYLDFLCGRPYFGKKIDTEWHSYGFLTNMEVNALLGYFEKFPQLVADAYGFGKDLKSYLQIISKKKKDLWFFSQ